jgi:uroporphyrinogen-III synthase
MRLLVTRPQPDGERTAAALRARGHEVIAAPLMRIEAVADAEFGAGPWGGVMVTSANAVRAIAQHPRLADLLGLPVFAVGRRTAEAARGAGFAEVTSADGDAHGLVRLIAGRHVRARLLYLAGEDRAVDLAEALGRAMPVETVVVYRAVPSPVLPAEVEGPLGRGELDGVLHFSQRTARIYLDCARRAGLLDRALAASHYCLSRQVAEPLIAAGAETVFTAPVPEEAALIALID